MIFADTHAHIYLGEFDADRPEVLQRAAEAGLRFIFLPNIDSTTIESLLACKQDTGSGRQVTSDKLPVTYLLMGLHPGSVNSNYHAEIDRVEKELNTGLYCGVGEIGIDLYWDKTYRKEQEEVFSLQLDFAIHFGLPVVVHTRNSFDIAAEIIESKKNPALKGIFHCFSGSHEQAVRALDMGFMLGIGGVVTYKNSGLQQVIEKIPLENLVLETDSPYLPPVPHRGLRNEPAYIPLIARKIAEIKQISIETVAEVTTGNALRIFKV